MSSWMTHHLPQFGGSIGEDPVLHCQHFSAICRHKKPENITLEEFKMQCFKLTLTNFAEVWYYSSTANCAGYYEDLRAQFLKEFSPPSLRHDTREKIINLKQSRDETLDEYYTYFDITVSRCPHHGFTNVELLQKFICGMRPVEWRKLSDAVGGSAMDLTMTEMWDLIDDLAEATKRRPVLQADERAPVVEANLEGNGEDNTEAMMDESETESTVEDPTWENTPEPSEDLEPETDLVWDEEEPTWGNTTEPTEEVPDITSELPEAYPTLTTEPAGEISQDQFLTDRLAEMEPALIMEASHLFPLINMQIAAHENNVINGELEGRMEESPKHRKARLKRPAAMVKGTSPSQRYMKEKPPEQWSPDPSTSSHKNSGRVKARINAGAAAKFALSRLWDPDPS